MRNVRHICRFPKNSFACRLVGILALLSAAGCSHLPGKPGFRPETLRPEQTSSFAVLYQRNCSGCHGDQGKGGAALPLNNPVYLAWAGHDAMTNIVANGVPHTLMPAFGPSGGGLLTDAQVQDIVNGMISHWGKPDILNGASVPSYAPTGPGDAARGKTAFQTNCARCHGSDGKGISDGQTSGSTSSAPSNIVKGSIVDASYLALISDQGLRDIIVAGMPGENMPDWQHDTAGVPGSKPMSSQAVTDIVAWLTSHSMKYPGTLVPSTRQNKMVP